MSFIIFFQGYLNFKSIGETYPISIISNDEFRVLFLPPERTAIRRDSLPPYASIRIVISPCVVPYPNRSYSEKWIAFG